ncbi:MAG: SDR family NAD(P)-dependent oxidoreductase, partial [Abditibacteriota bacterium]|nr:SDR family NAD(P)-dependent oxidoreductase [Abditibacteriota bacterium]
MNERYAGKNVIVTGSGTGIGREVALQFAREGANVVLHYAHSSAGAESAVEEIKKMGRKATAIKANFGDVEDVKRFGREAIAFLGKVDALVNNAGITFNKPYYEVTVEQFDMMYNVNIKAQYFLGQVIAEHMEKNGGGAILNVTSVHGVSGAPEHSVYAGTKGAIIAFTRSIASAQYKTGTSAISMSYRTNQLE